MLNYANTTKELTESVWLCPDKRARENYFGLHLYSYTA